MCGIVMNFEVSINQMDKIICIPVPKPGSNHPLFRIFPVQQRQYLIQQCPQNVFIL